MYITFPKLWCDKNEKWPGSWRKLFEEKGYIYGQNSFSFIRNDRAKNQYEWFQPKNANAFTKPGLGRLNASIEAFLHCIIGAQIQTRNSIVGNQETQQVFLELFFKSVSVNNITESIQNYQFAIQEAKLRLNFAIAPGTWLIAENLIINSNSLINYINNLKKVDENVMVFGVNNDINSETKKVGIAHNLGRKKVILPHTQKPQTKVKEQQNKTKDEIYQTAVLSEDEEISSSSSRENNKKVFLIVSIVIGWILFHILLK